MSYPSAANERHPPAPDHHLPSAALVMKQPPVHEAGTNDDKCAE
jgi:hypothetical protein